MMVPNEAIIKLAQDRNNELMARIEELSIIYNKKHDYYLRKLGTKADPIFGAHSRLWLNISIKNVISRTERIGTQLEELLQYRSIMDKEFRNVLMKIADRYSILLNSYMELKKKIMQTYADVYNKHPRNANVMTRLDELKSEVSEYVDGLETYLDVVKLAIKNEVHAYQVLMEKVS